MCLALQIALGLPCITGVHISDLLNPSQHMNHLGSLWVPHAQHCMNCAMCFECRHISYKQPIITLGECNTLWASISEFHLRTVDAGLNLLFVTQKKICE